MVILVQEVLFVVGKLKDLKDLYDEYAAEIDEVQISLRALKQILTAREDSAQAASHAALLGSGSIQEELRAVFNQMYGAVVEFDLVVNGYDGELTGGGGVDPLAPRGLSGWEAPSKGTLTEEEDRSVGSKRLTAAKKSKAFGRKLFAAAKAKSKIEKLTALKSRLDNLLKMAALETGTQQARSLQTLTGQNAADILSSLSDDCRLFWTQCFGSRTSIPVREFLDALTSFIGRDIAALLGAQSSVFMRIVQQMLLDGGGSGGTEGQGGRGSRARGGAGPTGSGDDTLVPIYSYLQLITVGAQCRNTAKKMTPAQRAQLPKKTTLVQAILGLMATFDGLGGGPASSLVASGHVVSIASLQTFNIGAQSHLIHQMRGASGGGGGIQSGAISAIARPTQVLLSFDLLGEIKVWTLAPNTHTLELLHTVRVFRPLRAVCILAPAHSDGDESVATYQQRTSTALAYVVDGGTSVEVSDLDGRNRFTAVECDAPVHAIAACQGRNGASLLFLLTALSSRVAVYDMSSSMNTATRMYTITGHSATVLGIEAGWLSCGTPVLLAVTALGEVAMWNVQTFTKIYSFTVPAPTCDGSFLSVVGEVDATVSSRASNSASVITSPTTTKPPLDSSASSTTGGGKGVTFANLTKGGTGDAAAGSFTDPEQFQQQQPPANAPPSVSVVPSLRAKAATIQKVRMIRYTSNAIWIAVLTNGWVVIYEIRAVSSPATMTTKIGGATVNFDPNVFMACPEKGSGHQVELVAALGSRNSYIADFDLSQACISLWVQSRHDTRRTCVAAAGSVLIWVWNRMIRSSMGLPPLYNPKYVSKGESMCARMARGEAGLKDGETFPVSGYDITRVCKGLLLIETGYCIRADPFRIPCISEPKGLALLNGCVVWGDDHGTLMACPTRNTSHSRCPMGHPMQLYPVTAEDSVECASCHTLLEDGVTFCCDECSIDLCFSCINPLITSNERALLMREMKVRRGNAGADNPLGDKALEDLDEAETMKTPTTKGGNSGGTFPSAAGRAKLMTESARITAFSGHASWTAHDLSLTTPFSKLTICHLPHGYMTVFGGHSISNWVLCGTFCGQVQVFGYSASPRDGGWVLRDHTEERGALATFPLLKRQRAALMQSDDFSAESLAAGFTEVHVDESMYTGTLGQSSLLSQTRPAVPTITVLTRVKQSSNSLGSVLTQNTIPNSEGVAVKLFVGSDQGHIGVYSCRDMTSQFRYLDSDSHCGRCGALPPSFVERLSNMCYGCYLVSYPISALRIPALLGEQYGAWVWKIPLRRVESTSADGSPNNHNGSSGSRLKAFFNRKLSSWKRRFLEVLPDPRGEIQAMLVYHENIPTETTTVESARGISDTASTMSMSTTRDRWSMVSPDALSSRISKSKGSISLSSRSTIEEVSVKEMLSLGCPVEVSMCGARVAVVSGGTELSGTKNRARRVEELFLAFENDHDRTRFLQLLSKQTLTPHSPCLNCRRTQPDPNLRRLVPKGEMLCTPCIQELSSLRCRSVSAIESNGSRVFVGLINTAPEREEIACMGTRRINMTEASVERIKARGGIIEEFEMDVSNGPKLGGAIRFSGEPQHLLCLGTQFLIVGTGATAPALQVYRCSDPKKTARSQLHVSLDKDGHINAIAACENTKRHTFCVAVDTTHEIHVHELVGKQYWDALGGAEDGDWSHHTVSDRQVLFLGRYAFTPSPSSRLVSCLHAVQLPDKSLEVSAGFHEGGIFVWKQAHFGRVREDYSACDKSLFPTAELSGHKSEVTSIIRHKEVLKSGANDNTVHFWRLDRIMRCREKRLDRNLLKGMDVEPAEWDWVWLAKIHNYRRDGPPSKYWHHHCSTGRRDPRFIALNKNDGRLLYQAWLQFRDKLLTPGKSTFHMPLSSFLQEATNERDEDESYTACFNIDYDLACGTLVAKRSMIVGRKDPITGECQRREVTTNSYLISGSGDDLQIEDAASLLTDERYLIFGYKTLATNSLEYSPLISGTNVLDVTVKRHDAAIESGDAICLPFPISKCGDCSGPFGTILSATVSFSVVSAYNTPAISPSRFGDAFGPSSANAVTEAHDVRLRRLRGMFHGYSIVAAQFVKIDSDEGQTYQLVNSSSNGMNPTVAAFLEYVHSQVVSESGPFSSSGLKNACSAGGLLWQLVKSFLSQHWEAAWGRAFGDESSSPENKALRRKSNGGVPFNMGVTFGVVAPTDEAVRLEFPGYVRHSILDTSMMLLKNVTPVETKQLTARFAKDVGSVVSARDVVATMFGTSCSRVTFALSREPDIPELQLTAAPGDLSVLHRNIDAAKSSLRAKQQESTTPKDMNDDTASTISGTSEGGLSNSMSLLMEGSTTSTLANRLLPSSDLGEYAKRIRANGVPSRADGDSSEDDTVLVHPMEFASGGGDDTASSHSHLSSVSGGADFPVCLDAIVEDEPMVIACPVCLEETTKEQCGWVMPTPSLIKKQQSPSCTTSAQTATLRVPLQNTCPIHRYVRMGEVSRDALCGGCQKPLQPLLRSNCPSCGVYQCLGCCSHEGGVCCACNAVLNAKGDGM